MYSGHDFFSPELTKPIFCPKSNYKQYYDSDYGNETAQVGGNKIITVDDDGSSPPCAPQIPTTYADREGHETCDNGVMNVK